MEMFCVRDSFSSVYEKPPGTEESLCEKNVTFVTPEENNFWFSI